MKSGFIRIHGNVGGQVGAAYRGSLLGMRDGTIIVDGFAGLEVGMRMKGGIIVIGGPAKDFTGLQMKGGTIVLMDGAEIRTGAWMTRGKIVSMKLLQMMPTFVFAGDRAPSFLSDYALKMKEFGINLPHSAADGNFQLYLGDTSVSDKGEILIWQPVTSGA
jgi:formylmethanofuran dehydrogenase subunit C